ncbi:MAG: DUF5659 domain-containing protein [Candidatus Acidiferrales bacterium]
MTTDVSSKYLTDHLYLAAFLICAGHSIIGTSRDGSRVCFVFRQTPDLSVAVASFMAGAAIPARPYAFEVLKLKKLIPRVESTLKRVTDATEKPAP